MCSKNYKFCIDAGHGGSDPGAVNGNRREKDAALAIALKVGKLLSDAGVDVIYTRTADKTVELSERTNLANNMSADFFISIHLNAAEAKAANGIETFCFEKTGKGYELARAVQEELIKATGATDRGVKTANFYVLKRTSMPAILIETGFISNEAECLALFKDGYQSVVASAIAKAVCKVIGLGAVEVSGDRYDRLEDIPAGEFRDTIKKLMDKGIVKGNHEGRLDLSKDMVRLLVMENRAGLYK